MNKLALIFVLCLLNQWAVSQSRFSIGFQGGMSKLTTFSSNYENDLPGFSPRGSRSGIGWIYAKYDLKSDFFLKLGVGGMHFGITSELDGVQGNVFSIGNQTLNPQIIFSGGKEIYFGHKGWGSYLSAGLSLTRLNLGEQRVFSEFSEEGMRFQGVIVSDGQGGFGEILANDIRSFNTSKDLLYHLRPEIAVFKKFGNQRLSLAFIYGYKFGEELYVVNYNKLSYFESNYTASHGTTGSFTSFQLGYELSF